MTVSKETLIYCHGCDLRARPSGRLAVSDIVPRASPVQRSFSELEYAAKKKQRRRYRFLSQIAGCLRQLKLSDKAAIQRGLLPETLLVLRWLRLKPLGPAKHGAIQLFL